MKTDIAPHKVDYLFFFTFCFLTILQILVVVYSPLDLSGDEAHYWEWSRNLDFAYYSKGPFIAYLIAAGRFIFNDNIYAVRLTAVLSYAIFSIAYYIIARSLFKPHLAFLSWLAQRSMLVFAQCSFLMTTDVPCALFWLLALYCAHLAIFKDHRLSWLFFGLFVGLGILSKYTVFLLLPSIILFLLVTPKYRDHLFSKEFFFGIFVTAFCSLPIFYWNMQHDWVNFYHNSGHVYSGKSKGITLSYLLELFVGQAALATPFIFVGICFAIYHSLKTFKKKDYQQNFFLLSSVVILSLVVIISLFKRVYANWAMPAYISGLLLLTHCLNVSTISIKPRLIKLGIALGFFMTALVHLPLFDITLGLPGKILTTNKLYGWSKLAKAVDENTIQYFKGKENEIFFLTDQYMIASEISFYSLYHPMVYVTYLDDRRMNQYDIWHKNSHWQSLKGKDAIVVLISPERANILSKKFQSLEPAYPKSSLIIEYSGSTIRQHYFYIGRNYNGEQGATPSRY